MSSDMGSVADHKIYSEQHSTDQSVQARKRMYNEPILSHEDQAQTFMI